MVNVKDQRKNIRILDSPEIVTAKRALGFVKMYIAIAIFITLISITYLNYGFLRTSVSLTNNTSSNSLSTNTIVVRNIASVALASGKSTEVLLSVPFTVLPILMLVVPIVILFVYDKNNGVLEYMLSLGMTQRDIYLRYLKAALLIAFLYLILFAIVSRTYLYVRFGAGAIVASFTVLLVSAVIALSTVAFMITMMMAFSSLQKSRAGGNQPLAVTLGMIGVIPGYIIPFVFSLQIAIAVEIAEGIVIVIASLVLLILSEKLIKREKFLP